MISIANPLNFTAVGVEGVQVEQDYTYVQEFLSSSVLRLQIQSNTEPVVELVGTGSTTAVTATRVAQRYNVDVTGSCFLASEGSGVTVIYFASGYLPDWLSAGAELTIIDGANDGVYTIASTAYSDTLGAFVARFAHTYTASAYAPAYTAETAMGLDVWECSILLSGLSNDCYYLTVDGLESNNFKVSEDLKHINYSNDDDNFQIVYRTGINFDFDIEAKLFDYAPGGEETIYTDDAQHEVKLDAEYFKVVTFQAEGIPGGMCEKLDVIFSHNNVEIDGIGYQVAEKGSRERTDGTNLYLYTIELQQVEDYAVDDSRGYILISDDDFLLPNANGRVPYE